MKRSLVALVFLAACQTAAPTPAPQTTQSTPPPTPKATSAETLVDHEGDSVETAVSVPADAPNGGADFENQWMFDRYGRFKRNGSGTGTAAGRRYNVVKIELENGEKRSVFFDITENWDRQLKE